MTAKREKRERVSLPGWAYQEEQEFEECPPAGEVRLTEESNVINIACIVLELQLFLGLLKWEGIGESEFTV